jgi:hypothetical protein
VTLLSEIGSWREIRGVEEMGKSGIKVFERLFSIVEHLNIASLSRRTFLLIHECFLS